MSSSVERFVDFDEEDRLAEACKAISEWHEEKKSEGSVRLKCPDDLQAEYLLHTEIRARFKDLWTFACQDDTIKSEDNDFMTKEITVKRVSSVERSHLEAADSADFVQPFVKKLEGFSTLFQLLADNKKILVGHNCLGDVIRLWRQFIGDLPADYGRFKRDLHKK